jgi:hypothetical protein
VLLVSSIAPSPVAFTCPICTFIFPTRKLPLKHLRRATDNTHKLFKFGACESAQYYPQLAAQGVLAFPRGCGALFNGGDSGSSEPLEAHIARGSCRDRRPQAPPPELDGPFLATTVVGVRASFPTQAATTMSVPHMAPPHASAVELCRENPAFTPIHL